MTGLLLPPLLMLLAALIPGERADAPPGERGCSAPGAPVAACERRRRAPGSPERPGRRAPARFASLRPVDESHAATIPRLQPWMIASVASCRIYARKRPLTLPLSASREVGTPLPEHCLQFCRYK
ncbi:hypothetical protein HPB50_002350 [Hyalomma asiaticum]|uniref:Uncharacterized protein n=1 Tax=Hyalomma asiaticum TaxID=266040 RepID=A0ACB7TBL7_HYAAI|nr:hypothetical protein HPB50_002350 [Hyalomma asiaticum]